MTASRLRDKLAAIQNVRVLAESDLSTARARVERLEQSLQDTETELKTVEVARDRAAASLALTRK